MPFSSFDAVLFDKDGTIFDSEQACCDAWMHTAKEFDVEFTADMFKAFIGIPTQECYDMAHRQFGSTFPMQDFIAGTRHYLMQSKRKGLPIKQGFDRFFNYLMESRVLVGVVTSSNAESAQQSFQPFNYRDKLDVLVTFDDVASPKPDPECYLIACKKLAVRPERVLVFEDSNTGIRASMAAGCQTIAIPDLLEIESGLAARCLHVLPSFDDVYVALGLRDIGG